MSSRPLRVGVVGVGYLGRFHAEKYASIESVQLVGVVDIDRSRADQTASKCRTSPFYDAKDLLPHVDAVSIAVPTSEHFRVATLFLESGKHVLLEKPIAVSLGEADHLIALARENGSVFQVGHLERFNPAVRELKPRVHHPKFIEVHRMSPFPERNYDVDVVLDLMIHDLDLILSFVSSPLESLDAVGVPVISENVDIANVRLRFQNGCIANVTASRASVEQQRKFRLFQSDFYASLNFEVPSLTICRRVMSQPQERWPQIEAETLTFEKKDPLFEEITAFVASVQANRRPEVTGEEARNALEVALKIEGEIEASLRKAQRL